MANQWQACHKWQHLKILVTSKKKQNQFFFFLKLSFLIKIS